MNVSRPCDVVRLAIPIHVAAARPPLVIELREDNPVLHELPAWSHVHLHVLVLPRWIAGGWGSSRTLGLDI